MILKTFGQRYKMAFLKVSADGKATTRRNTEKSKGRILPRKKDGIVYLIKCELACGTTVVKIGITTRRSIIERLAENMIAMFQTMRYIPHTTVRRFKRTPYYTEIEKALHVKYAKDRHVFAKKFTGYTEYFKLTNEDELLETYDSMIKAPLEYITPTVKAEVIQCKAKSMKDLSDASVNDLDPVIIEGLE